MPVRLRKVDDNVLRGGEPSVQDLKKLKHIGINKIISLDEDIGLAIDHICQKLGLEHEIIPLTDGNGPAIPALKNNISKLFQGGPIYVHCRHGKDRTGMTIAMYRIMTGWSLSRALQEARSLGMGTGLSESVKKSYYDAVKQFYEEFGDNNKADIVELSRERTTIPAIGVPEVTNFGRGSFCPFQDAEGENAMGIRASTKIYRRCNPSDISKSAPWFVDQQQAGQNGKLFEAVIPINAKVRHLYTWPTTVQLSSAKIDDVDIVIINNSIYLVIDPKALRINEDISEVADMPVVGLTGQLPGEPLAWSNSGGGVMENGYGGFAGTVTLPFGALGL